MTVKDIAALVGGACEGDAALVLLRCAPLESAGEDELSFAANRKLAEAVERSNAACLIVPPDFPSGRTLIRAADPRAAFARAIAALHPPAPPAPGVHPTATVAPDVRIGEGSSIGPGCSLGAGVRIGRDCVLHANVTLYPGVTLADRVVLHAGCVLGADGFGYAFTNGRYEKFPQIGRVEIANDVEIGANSCVDRAALGVTTIGEGSKLDNLVHIGHNCRIGRHVAIAAQTGLSGGVVVEDYAVIGGQVGIGDKARIESGVVLGSGSGVLTSKIVRKGEPLWGVPARPLREHLAQLANLARLPKLRSEVAALVRRIEKLEKPR